MTPSASFTRSLRPSPAARLPAADPNAGSGPGALLSSQRLVAPQTLREAFPLSRAATLGVTEARRRVASRVQRGDGAPLAIVGPCSIHCEGAALEYAERLALLRQRLAGRVEVLMRVYFEKPRTTVGWKGFLYDPDLDGSDDLGRGLERCRRLMVAIAELGVPIATELLDPLIAPYLEDCLSWVAIGARTTESQIHRQLASGLACPVGFKNGTDGGVEIALDAIHSAAAPHVHLGVDGDGHVALRRSSGNPAAHIVLRGGRSGPNYQVEAVAQVLALATARGIHSQVVIDCSHGNSRKDHNQQLPVARAVIAQLAHPRTAVAGLMLESHLCEGRQDVGKPLRYGVSVTDACIDFQQTERLLLELADAG